MMQPLKPLVALFLLGANMPLLVTSQQGVLPFNVDPKPWCAKIDPISLKGIGAFVDTDNNYSSGLFPTTGDLSISVNLQPSNGLPPDVNSLTIQTVCTVLTDQVPGSFSAPACALEAFIEFDFQGATIKGKFMAYGSGPDPYAITGGTNLLFGAFGQVDTTTLSQSPCATQNCDPGDIIFGFAATISICWWLQ